LRESGLISDGKLVRTPSDVERLANVRGLQIVGSERKGKYRLPGRRKGLLRVADREIVVDSRVLDGDKSDQEFREIVAHEIAHDVLHSHFGDQQSLPFAPFDNKQLHVSEFAFSRDQNKEFEREAIMLGALLQVPAEDLWCSVVEAVLTYSTSLSTSHGRLADEIEGQAATLYCQLAASTIASRLDVSSRTALFVLSYWDAHERPTPEWIRRARNEYLLKVGPDCADIEHNGGRFYNLGGTSRR
jgi:hypothetical protein